MVFKDGKVTEYSCGNFEEDGSTGEAGSGEPLGLPGASETPEMVRLPEPPERPADRARLL